MIQRFETFVTAITQIYRSIQKLKVKEMADFGLKGSHVMILFHLKKHPEGLTAALLCQYCEEDKAAVSRTLNELQALDLICIEEHPGQRRYRSSVTLSDKGNEITTEMEVRIKKAVGLAAQGYSDEQRELFYQVLLQISANLQRYAEE